MKTQLTSSRSKRALAIALALLAGSAHAATDENGNLDIMGLVPSDRLGVKVDTEERNPYANRQVAKTVVEDTETEAARIRRVLTGLNVVGMSKGPRGMRILLGDLVLQEGAMMPSVVQGQTDRIMVTGASEKEVELTWVVESGKPVTDGRRITIKFDLKPKVEVVLPGQKPNEVKEGEGLMRDWAQLDMAVNRNPGETVTQVELPEEDPQGELVGQP